MVPNYKVVYIYIYNQRIQGQMTINLLTKLTASTPVNWTSRSTGHLFSIGWYSKAFLFTT